MDNSEWRTALPTTFPEPEGVIGICIMGHRILVAVAVNY